MEKIVGKLPSESIGLSIDLSRKEYDSYHPHAKMNSLRIGATGPDPFTESTITREPAGVEDPMTITAIFGLNHLLPKAHSFCEEPDLSPLTFQETITAIFGLNHLLPKAHSFCEEPDLSPLTFQEIGKNNLVPFHQVEFMVLVSSHREEHVSLSSCCRTSVGIGIRDIK
ncbi:hypothetical protein HAX54_004475 [Datura stramonium]|uniref:Uncharacterized protein n=1 Tax=Datura stramonium TaxID=4076 RepID=A0ABS8WSW5_DATST|nr:hypothetical protein [Datura stramonium]